VKPALAGIAGGTLLAALALSGPAPANPYSDREAPKAPEVVLAAKFDAALNAGRLDEALSFLADDGTVRDLGGRAITGRAALTAWLQDAINRHYHADAGIRQLSDGGRVTWTASLADDTLRSLNAAPAAAFIEAIVVDGRIRSWVPRVMAGDRLKIQAAQARANEAVVRTVAEAVVGKGQLDLLERLCTTDFIDHDPLPGSPPTVAGYRQGLATLRGACSGLAMSIDDVIAADDRVVVRGVLSGTQTGAINGIPSAGKSFKVGYIDIVRVRDGRMAEHWGRIDTAGLRQQLQPAGGGTPAPSAPAKVPGKA